MKNYHKILGVTKESTPEEVKKAYRELAKKYHPDVNKEPGAEFRFKEVNEAYDHLKDGKNAVDEQEAFNPFAGGPVDFAQRFRQAVFKPEIPEVDPNINVAMEIAFSSAAIGSTEHLRVFQKNPCPECVKNKAKDTFKTMKCSHCNGSGRTIVQPTPFFSMTSTCPHCAGSGKKIACDACSSNHYITSEKVLSIKFPAGIEEGQILRVSGSGNYSYRTGSYGDLFVHVNIKPHAVFKREKLNIYSNIDVDYVTCLLGGKISVETIFGDDELEIPYCTQRGAVLKLDGAGINGQGNHYFNINVSLPKALSKKEKKLLEKINIIRNTKDPNANGGE